MILLSNEEYFKTNLKRWDELVNVNANSKSYNLERFKEGETSLFPVELKELGDVEGKSMLHLQCHFGMDTLSWARLGAKVTGVDFSGEAISLARSLSIELKIPADFIQSNIYDIPNMISDKFDIVFTSYGVLCWLPDLVNWAEIIESCLKPGGTFYVIDSHPFGFLINENDKNVAIGYNYFTGGKAIRFDDDNTYVDTEDKIKNTVTYEFFHTMGDILNSLLNTGLEVEFIHEFPFGFFQFHPDMKKREDGYWEFESFEYSIPMIFSLKAHKKL